MSSSDSGSLDVAFPAARLVALVRRLAGPGPQARIDATIRGEGERGAEQAAGGHVPDVVAVVLDAGDCDEQRADEGREGEQRGGEGRAGAQGVQLGAEEERDERHRGEGEGGVARGEGAPAVLKDVARGLDADFVREEGVLGRVGRLWPGLEEWSG